MGETGTSSPAFAEVDGTGARILDAAMATLLRFGVKRTTMESIAREAGVSHMTVYRRWRRKDDLLLAVWMREGQRLFDELDERVAEIDSAEDKLVEGFVTIYWFFHTHPLLGLLLDTEAETILPAVTTGATLGITWAQAYLAEHIRMHQVSDGARALDPQETAEVAVRICQSLILTPRLNDPLDSEDAARRYARRILVPLLLG
ncbi:TetR/AcrR family transcriptional regulator [Nocardia sp. NBC_00511]|uniref:TetR/AcrR family transcriptional regulator n=1 Tax=Nocardia sp. NBC_00511 TaxID=2903591 RepID=UPI0030E3D055